MPRLVILAFLGLAIATYALFARDNERAMTACQAQHSQSTCLHILR